MDANEFAEITSVEDLDATISEINEQISPLVEQGRSEGAPLSTEDRAKLRDLLDRRDAADARRGEVVAAAEADQAELDALLERAGTEDVEDVVEDEPVAEAPEIPTAEVVPVVPAEPVEAEPVAVEAPVTSPEPALVAAADRAPVTTAPRRRTAPHSKPTTEADREAAKGYGTSTALVASGDTSVATRNSRIDWDQAEEALLETASRFVAPSGDGKTRRLEKHHVAQLKVSRPDEFVLTGDPETDGAKIKAALDPKRTMANGGQGLVAAGGWCAPSEILYDIPVVGENATDGILSIPEMVAARGGVKSTFGPIWSDVYAAIGFHQTETEAIAGETKDCYEVPCTSFTETRLDVEGVCLIVPILTEAGYPELVQRYMSAAATVHARKINAFKIAAIATGSTAQAPTGLVASTMHGTLDGLANYAEYVRYQFSMGFNDVIEVVAPHWILNYYLTDLELRVGHNPADGPLTEADVKAWFASRNLSIQFVYQYQNMAEPDARATTYDVLMYPAGTWLGLTKDVINLGAVYDAASLATNVYTGMFSEEGVAVRKMTAAPSYKVTLPICSAGRTGASNLTCA